MAKTFKEYLILRGYSPTTINVYETLARVFERDGYKPTKDGLESFIIRHNYPVARYFLKAYMGFKGLSDIDIPKISGRLSKRLPKYLTKDEINKLIDIVPIREELMIRIMYEGGLRVSEVCKLKKENIEFKNCKIRSIGKGNKEFITNIKPYTSLELFKYTKDKSSEDLIFNIKPNRTYKLLVKYGRLALNKPVTPHQLRHSCGTNLRNEGVDLRIIQEYLRHENLETVKIYTHVTRTEIDKAWQDSIGKD